VDAAGGSAAKEQCSLCNRQSLSERHDCHISPSIPKIC
jgi:hypothetical protein